MPIAIVIGIGGSLVYRWISDSLILIRSLHACVTFFALFVLITGGYASAKRYDSFGASKNRNAQAINWIRSNQLDLILSDSHMLPMLSVRAPEVYAQAHPMGWETFWGENTVPPQLADIVMGVRHSKPVGTILVILNNNNITRAFPRRHTLLNTYFELDNSLEAPNFSVRLYTRKAFDPTFAGLEVMSHSTHSQFTYLRFSNFLLNFRMAGIASV